MNAKTLLENTKHLSPAAKDFGFLLGARREDHNSRRENLMMGTKLVAGLGLHLAAAKVNNRETVGRRWEHHPIPYWGFD